MKKKLTAAILLSALAVSSAAGAFDFPEPDWGALLNERTAMVSETDFELYAEAPITSAPYYGAKFEPVGGTYLGAIPENSTPLMPLGAYLTYIDNMRQDDFYYPANSMISSDSVITMAGWTIDDLGSVDLDHVRTVLQTLNSYGKPIFVRFANEMNGSALGDDPTLYVDTFRSVANMIHEYPNLAVVWSPMDIGSLDRPFEYYYPGDEYVDWIGVSCYTIKYFLGNQNTSLNDSIYFMTGDYGWTTNRLKPVLKFMQDNNINKPVMISEGGVAVNNQYGEALEEWAKPRLRNMLWNTVMKYPQVKMINYFDVYRENEVEHFDISDCRYAIDIFNDAKNNGPYIPSYGADASYVFQPAAQAGTLAAENGYVPVYMLAHIPGTPTPQINYSIDGVWYHAVSEAPYTCPLNVGSMTDGAHTLTVSAAGLSKDYTFYKNGSSISFAGPVEYTPPAVTVTLNGNAIAFDQPPIIQDGRTLVPMRAIFEALGAEVSWDGGTQTVTAYRGESTMTLTIGSSILSIDGREIVLDVPAQLVNDRTLVPVRAVSESFGCGVDWNGDTQTVIITN